MVTSREDFVKQALVDFESPLIGYATTFLHDAERARDVVQDTFIRLYQQDIDKVSGWSEVLAFYGVSEPGPRCDTQGEEDRRSEGRTNGACSLQSENSLGAG